MINSGKNHEEEDRLFERLLLQELKNGMKEKLMNVLEKDVDDIVNLASANFEISVKKYMDHYNDREMVNYLIRKH